MSEVVHDGDLDDVQVELGRIDVLRDACVDVRLDALCDVEPSTSFTERRRGLTTAAPLP